MWLFFGMGFHKVAEQSAPAIDLLLHEINPSKPYDLLIGNRYGIKFLPVNKLENIPCRVDGDPVFHGSPAKKYGYIDFLHPDIISQR